LPDFKPLVVRDDPDWIDLQFWILRHDTLDVEGEPFAAIGAGAHHQDRKLGFRLLYPLKWVHTPEQGVFSPAAQILFLDAKPYSDAFIQCLASLWRVDAPTQMAPMTAVAAYGSYGGHPEHVLTEEVHALLVAGEAGNGQMHLSVNLAAGTVTLHEREPDDAVARHAIVQALAKGS
jgi:hypothetical protein